MNTCDTVVQVCGMLWCAKNQNHTCTWDTHFGNTAGLTVPMLNTSCAARGLGGGACWRTQRGSVGWWYVSLEVPGGVGGRGWEWEKCFFLWMWNGYGGKGTYRLGEHGCLRRPMHEGGGLCGYSLLEFNWVGSTAGRNNELELEWELAYLEKDTYAACSPPPPTGSEPSVKTGWKKAMYEGQYWCSHL